MKFLNEIVELKKKRLAAAKAARAEEELKRAARARRDGVEKHRLRAALGRDGINVIAEIKRASPSKGVINDRIDVAETARAYELGGACAISVLTEEDRFQGSLADLETARAAVSLPILRKDFVIDAFQIYEAAAAGADVVLLIAAILDDRQMNEFHRLAEDELGMDALVEVHTLEELERVNQIGPPIVGVNNRDLHSFRVSLDVSRELVRHAPAGTLLIAESGLSTRTEIEDLQTRGFRGFLIGETLMRSGDPATELAAWTGK
ncbi:MAG: indole-3-glycerol phosphate synthase TrpC [Acidobacteria bacterium]|nr:indole-3-glycerol phosphate synthase TrpC [Acidobacteriota bacterium]